MAIVEFPILMNEYTVWLDKPDGDYVFNLDVWVAENQLKSATWWNEDILYLIEKFDCLMLVEV